MPCSKSRLVGPGRRQAPAAGTPRGYPAILAGEPFAAIAEEASEDPGSAAAGGDLGLVARGVMDPAFEQAAFDLEPDTVSEPVRSRFGYHLIEVIEIQGGEPKPFEAVRDELAREVSSGQSEAAYFDVAERLATLAYESPDSLIPAETLQMEIQTSDWFDRSGGGGIFASPKITGAAFREDVLTMGNNSELIEPDPEVMQAIVLRVDDHRPASVRPLEEVREQVVDLIQQRKSSETALAAASAMVERLQDGERLAAVAGDFEVRKAGLVGRNAAVVPPAVLWLGFSMPRSDAGGVRADSAETGTGDAVVVVLPQVVDGDPSALDQSARASEARLLSDTLARSAYEYLLDDPESRATIQREALPPDTQL